MIGALRSITVELDDETIRGLSLLGEPVAVLTRLARAAADGVRGPGRPTRERTDGSLQVERDKADHVIAEERGAVEAAADEVVRVARERADRVVETARESAVDTPTTEARSERARAVLDHERSSADATLEAERATGKKERASALTRERDKADHAIEEARGAVEAVADEVVRVARERADRVVETARESAVDTPTTEARSERARAVLDHERSSADATLEAERATGKKERADALTRERGDTDRDLSGERVQLDSLIVDQREANEMLLVATLAADEAKAQAEESASALREVAEVRELFIGVLGHDLRTPLASIITGAGLLLQRGSLDDRGAATVARIIRSCQRITRMITQLLDLTHARLGGGLPIEPRPTDLREVCRDVVEEFEADIRVEVEGDLAGTWDPDRLAEVLSNLVGNAVEYGAPGTIVVRMHADAARAVVEVSNRGEPIPASVLPFIFEPFRRAKQGEKSANGNLGLGLYIAQQIALSHGGALDVRSADGATTFVLRLPRHSPPNTPPPMT